MGALWREYRGFVVVILLVVGAGVAPLTSCGDGEGDSSGGLCEQCGDDPDGPCQGESGIPDFQVAAGSDDAERLCDDPAMGCTVTLSCLRRLGSSQRRCYPFAADPLFECEGDRANPATNTPVPTRTPTPSPTPTGPTPTVTPNTGPTSIL
jgi:hypothetical protein